MLKHNENSQIFISQSGKEVDGLSRVLVVRTQEWCGAGQEHT